MAIDEGRLDVRRAALAGGFVLGSLVCAALGAWLVTLAQTVLIVAWLGAGIVVCALAFGGTVGYIAVVEVLDHRERVRAWHTAALLAYEEQNGVELEQTLTEWELSAWHPMHVLLVALSVQRRYEQSGGTPWSVRGLEGPVFIGGVRFGEVPASQARLLGQQFAEMGLIEGRAAKSAGQWAARDAGDVIELVARNWGRCK
jgi:hypothetical protein